MKTHLVIGDPHAHPDFSNDRADWLGKLILDLKPDVVVNMGDTADLASMSSFDKGKASFHGRNYQKDIEAHLDFQDRMWHPIKKAKRKLPHRVVLEGNHENRIKKAIQYSPELEGDMQRLSEFCSVKIINRKHDYIADSFEKPLLGGLAFPLALWRLAGDLLNYGNQHRAILYLRDYLT